MLRRVNNLFKIHKAKLVPSVRLGALVELHQWWVWLCCSRQQPQLRAQETSPAGMTKIPPQDSTAKGWKKPTTQGQDNCIFHLFGCTELWGCFPFCTDKWM